MFKWYEIAFASRTAWLAESPEDALEQMHMQNCGRPDIRILPDEELTEDERDEMNEANFEADYLEGDDDDV